MRNFPSHSSCELHYPRLHSLSLCLF